MTVMHEPGADSIGAGASASESDLEIEITPAMLAAGVSAYFDYDGDEAETVADIYRAMVMAKVHRRSEM